MDADHPYELDIDGSRSLVEICALTQGASC
jgi:hypothetical protein